jgi:hypothetical protein
LPTETFSLVARVSTDDPEALEPVLRRMTSQGHVEKTASHEFVVTADFKRERVLPTFR